MDRSLEAVEDVVTIPIAGAELEATMAIPEGAAGVVVFAHGSGSDRHSPRNRFVADALVEAGFGALLLDLLTPTEERHDAETRELRFDIDRLASRVVAGVDWLAANERARRLPVGAYGASTGAAAALIAAAERPERILAVVSRGGRPDLAKSALELVGAPILLIVGEQDPAVLDINADASERMRMPATIEVVPGAGHLFEEEDALERVAELTVRWFRENLSSPTREGAD